MQRFCVDGVNIENASCVDADIFCTDEKMRFQKCPDTCGQSLSALPGAEVIPPRIGKLRCLFRNLRIFFTKYHLADKNPISCFLLTLKFEYP